jgi:hypothetical protein
MTAFLDDYFPTNAEVQTETLPIPRGILGSSTTEPEGPSRFLSPVSSLARCKVVFTTDERASFVSGESSIFWPTLLTYSH